MLESRREEGAPENGPMAAVNMPFDEDGNAFPHSHSIVRFIGLMLLLILYWIFF